MTFVAVQRITTARWSRRVIRFMEGYVAFLPVAFVFLLLTLFVGPRPRLPVDARGVSESRRRRRTSIGAFLTIRDIVIFGADRRARALVHLHVAAARRRPRFRSGAPSGRRAFARGCATASAKSVARFTRRIRCRASSPCSRWSLFAYRLVGAVVGPFDGADAALPEHAVQLVVLHGRLALRAHAVLRCIVRAWNTHLARRRRPDHGDALPRHRKALLRVHGVLGLSDVRPVPRDLVRQHGRGDVLHASPTRSRRGCG